MRSHAQKFFLKLEKSGQADVVPPPRPKKRAAKPYPVQERSEERRKSKRSRTSNSNSSAHSQPSHTRGALTPSSSPSNGRSSPRSAATAATAPGSSSRPLRSTRVTRGLAQALKGSSQDLEGVSNKLRTMRFPICLVFHCSLHARLRFAVSILQHVMHAGGILLWMVHFNTRGSLFKAVVAHVFHVYAGNGSNIASANESNNEYSEGPSANQENSGLSTGCADLGLQLSSAGKLDPPTVRFRHIPMLLGETVDWKRPFSKSSLLVLQALPSPEVKTEPANYGKLYSIVNGLFDSGGGSNEESSHKQMMEQLEPGQRYARRTSPKTLAAISTRQ